VDEDKPEGEQGENAEGDDKNEKEAPVIFKVFIV